MPRTPHPKNYVKGGLVPDDLIGSDAFDLRDNDLRAASQANETYSLHAKKDHALGSGGETRAFAKYKVDAMGAKLGADTSILFKGYDNTTLRHPDGTRVKDENGKVIPLIKGMAENPLLGGDRGMLTRQVASYEADKLLGLNSLSEERFATDKRGNVMGISVQADGAAVTGKGTLLDIDYSDPRVQRGMSDLEVSDYITGQVDRHPGNIYVDPKTGKVTGIDNDMAFPEVGQDVLLQRDKDNRKFVTGMPRRMHEDTAAKILATDPEDLRATLSKPPPGGPGAPQALSKEAIDGAVSRLQELQAELQKPNCSIKVVQAFNKNTYDETIKEQVDQFNQENAKYDIKYDQLDDHNLAELGSCQKTSYLGSIEIAKKRDGLNPDVNMQLKRVTDGPEAGRVGNYEKGAELAKAYQQMSPTQQKQFDKSLKELNKLEDKLDEKLKHLAKLEHPSFKEKVTALTKGGISGVKTSEQNKVAQLQQDIAAKELSLQNMGPVITKTVSIGATTVIPPQTPKTTTVQTPVLAPNTIAPQQTGDDTQQKTTIPSVRADYRPQNRQRPKDVFQEIGKMTEKDLGKVDPLEPGKNGTKRTTRDDLPKPKPPGDDSLKQDAPKVGRKTSTL
ncbi:MAG TPA: hypothetical protein VLE43_00980 [Candidatus Saccharimonadia bacterium]|nr:hypothetical protein [Candidatus Saccharimonadia bacterium]